jgi:hypothetical protein
MNSPIKRIDSSNKQMRPRIKQKTEPNKERSLLIKQTDSAIKQGRSPIKRDHL